MVRGRLPGEGPARLGPVPPGKLIGGHAGRDRVAWATVDPVPESGRVWAALSELHPQTGLVPIQLDGLGGDTRRPWDDGDFIEPADPARRTGWMRARCWAHGATPQARIGLVAADRSADVLLAIGWAGLVNSGESLLDLTAVLRSWEDRFGARLIDVGYAGLRLLAERPPRTLEAARRLADEQVVVADDCIDGARDIPGIAARLADGPVWTFWWD
jgi:hypothetical protein